MYVYIVMINNPYCSCGSCDGGMVVEAVYSKEDDAKKHVKEYPCRYYRKKLVQDSL